MPIDETAIQIPYPGQGQGEASVAQSECRITARDYSICVKYARLALAADLEIGGVLRDVAVLLQSHCNNLMRDYPRAAVGDLRSAVLVLAETVDFKGDTIIRGEKIDV